MTPIDLDRAAYLLLEDGRRFDGYALGADGETLGEVVFNTSMTGYQEIITDPSYTGQIVVMTYPLLGNYGVTPEDEESDAPHIAGFVVREVSRRPSSWRATGSLPEYLSRHGIVGIQDVDTRALTRHIRAAGALRGAIAPGALPEDEVLSRVRAHPAMAGLDLTGDVSTGAPYEVPASGEPRFHVIAFDFGVKSHSPRLLSERGCRVTVLPPAELTGEILARNPDGVFISNGPGDPAAVELAEEAIRSVAESGVPVFGICLGHQLIARAFGGSTYKLPFGHHGGNHPVTNLRRNTVEITAQNHGFAVQAGADGSIPGAPDLRVTHRNLYDGTAEGVSHETLPVFAVQYHPEAAPGPHDSRYLFDEFLEKMTERKSGRS